MTIPSSLDGVPVIKIGAEFLTVFDEAGLVGLSWYDAGARCFYTNAHPIRTPADMAGLTVRVQDSQLVIDMVKALGAEPVTFPYGDVSYAFEMHKIDVAENNWPAYGTLEHYRLAKFYTVDQHSRVPEVQLASSRTWEKLPHEYREIIAACARESALYQRELWREQETQSRADVIAAGAVEDAISSLPAMTSVSYFLVAASLSRWSGFPRCTAAFAFLGYQAWLWAWIGTLHGGIFARMFLSLPVGALTAVVTAAVLAWAGRKAAIDEQG